MNSREITDLLQDIWTRQREVDVEQARLTMLAIATRFREHWSAAAYVELTVTDQDTSGSLWEVDVYHADMTAVPHAALWMEQQADWDPIGSNLNDGNKSVWLPFMSSDTRPDRYRFEYLLDIDKVLAEIVPVIP